MCGYFAQHFLFSNVSHDFIFPCERTMADGDSCVFGTDWCEPPHDVTLDKLYIWSSKAQESFHTTARPFAIVFVVQCCLFAFLAVKFLGGWWLWVIRADDFFLSWILDLRVKGVMFCMDCKALWDRLVMRLYVML